MDQFPGEWLSLRRFTSKLPWSWSWSSRETNKSQINTTYFPRHHTGKEHKQSRLHKSIFNKIILPYYGDMKSNNIYTFPYLHFLPNTGHKSKINGYPVLLINKLALLIVQISLHAMFIMQIQGVLQKFVEKCCNLITVKWLLFKFSDVVW